MPDGVFPRAAALFLAGLCLHVAVWRWRRPSRHLPALLAVFCGPWLAWSAWACFSCPAGCACGACAGWAWISLLHLSLSAAYIQTYPAAQARSPSLRILLLVSEAMPQGLRSEQLLAGMDPRSMLSDRIQDLLDSGHLREAADGRLTLAPTGAWMILPFQALRRFLGLGRGKG